MKKERRKDQSAGEWQQMKKQQEAMMHFWRAEEEAGDKHSGGILV